MRGDIGDPFVKCMRQINMECIGKDPSHFYEMSLKLTNWVTDPFRWFYELLCKVCG